MVALEGTENRINVERTRYNEAVRDYNTTIRTFPAYEWRANIILRLGAFGNVLCGCWGRGRGARRELRRS